jgi:hypothetical protein
MKTYHVCFSCWLPSWKKFAAACSNLAWTAHPSAPQHDRKIWSLKRDHRVGDTTRVCTENLVRFDLMTESLHSGANDHPDILPLKPKSWLEETFYGTDCETDFSWHLGHQKQMST